MIAKVDKPKSTINKKFRAIYLDFYKRANIPKTI